MAEAQFESNAPIRQAIRVKLETALDDLEHLRSLIARYSEPSNIEGENYKFVTILSKLDLAELQLLGYISQQLATSTKLFDQHPTRREIDNLCFYYTDEIPDSDDGDDDE